MRTQLSWTFRRVSNCWKALTLLALLYLMIQSVRHFRQPLPVATPVRVIGYYCEGICGGWADRQKGIVTAFVLAAMLGKQFKIHMPRPCELSFFLSPRGDVNWRLDPGELVGRQVQWIDRLDSTAVSFLQNFLALENPMELFHAEFVFLKSNMEVVHLLKKHRLAQRMHWLQELSIPDIYRLVLTELFTLMPGPRVLLETFQQSIPSGTKLICAQIRVGGKGDVESFNTVEQFHALASFLAPYNSSPTYRFMFTSDSPAMIEHARSYFPSRTVAMKGPITHVDRSVGDNVCAGFVHAILEQLVLSTCDVLVISESGLAKIAAFFRNTDKDLYLFHDGIVDKFVRKNPFLNRNW